MDEFKKILLVEDNPYIMNINARLLSMNGYEVLQATTVAEARDLLKHNPVELVFTTTKMRSGPKKTQARKIKE